ncbi:MAG: DUF5050 domain-containing protein, partial [Clostridia bacterium]|nr:DUF5050 domain-containing protein [Clostridia bacterium]
AVLKITANYEESFMGYSNNVVLYFQNALYYNAFYLYDTITETIKKVSDGNVEDIINYQDDVMFVSKTIFISSIQTASYTSSKVEKETVYTQAGLRYIQNEGNIVYYVVNGLTNDASGIYKIDCNVNDPVPVRLSVGKAYYLQLVDNTLYFADGANGKKLSKINTTDQDQTRTLVVDEKINNLINSDGVLYYTVNKLLGNYIERYTISNQTRRKLTIDAGESLTIVGNKLYYVNVDAFTTNLIGNGIYCVDKSPLVDCNSTGTKVIDGGSMGVCSLETDGTNLYYYDVNGYKLMQHKLSSGETTNILEDFVKPADTPPLSTGSKLQYYNGNIYYLDLWDGKTLHCYNPVAQINYPLTTEKVVDFNIIGDVLYVNMVSWIVNNDVYSVNLKTGGSLEKISTYSAFEFVSDGTSIYYIEENAAGAKTAIHKCNFDGTADEIIYDKGVTNLRLVGNTLYFVDGNNIHAFNLTTKEDVIIKVDDREIHTTAFDTDGTYLYYRDMYGFLYGSKRLSRCKLDGTENIVMVSDIDPVNIVYQDGLVYYYSDTSSTAKNGLFKVSASITATTTGTTILAESSNLYAKDFVVVGDKVYFVDYKAQLVGEEHLYVLTIGESQATLIK